MFIFYKISCITNHKNEGNNIEGINGERKQVIKFTEAAQLY
jgi:hypothetical protein